MKKGAVVIFVKTPGLSPVKTRLGESIGKSNAEKFYQLSCAALEDVVSHLKQSSSAVEVNPVWAVAETAGLKHPAWQGFDRVDQGTGGLGDRLAKVYGELIAKYDFVVFLGADCPHITIGVIDEAVRLLQNAPRFVLGMADDGGFYLFGGNSGLDREAWTRVPYSEMNTAELLAKELGKVAPVKKLQSFFDIDTVEELRRLKKLLTSKKDLLPHQGALLKWMNEASF